MKKETGRFGNDAQNYAADLDDEAGQVASDTHRAAAGSGDEGGPLGDDTHLDYAALISEVSEKYKLRVDFHRAEKRLTLQIKALCRRIARNTHCGGEKCGAVLCAKDMKEAAALYAAIDKGTEGAREALLAASACYQLAQSRSILKSNRLVLEKQLRDLAMKLPVWEWAEKIRGFGALGLAQIVGEAGDLSKYANPGKLWKRMGCGMVEGKDGWERQRRVKGAEALKHGYSPQRRAVLYCIGDALVKVGTDYRELYLKQKLYYAENRVYESGEKAGQPWSKGHCHNAAQRYMEKRLLRELWKAWRGCR